MAVAARFAVLQNDRANARHLVDQGTAVAAQIGDILALGRLLVPDAMLAVWDGAPGTGAEQADTAVAMLQAASDLPGELLALFVAGVCHGFAGNPLEASARHRQCITRADEVGERHLKALAMAGLGEQELAAGQLDEATVLFGDAIVMQRDLGTGWASRSGWTPSGESRPPKVAATGQRLLLGAAESIWDVVGMSQTGQPVRVRAVALRRPSAGTRPAGKAAVP